jgi:hypothetical protein
MSVIEPQKWERAILDNRRIYANLTDAEFIAWFAKKFPAVTEKQVAAVLHHYKAGESA